MRPLIYFPILSISSIREFITLPKQKAESKLNQLNSFSTTEINVKKALWIIIIVAILLRVLSALYQGNIVEPLPGTFDQISYHALAQRVVDGVGFSFDANHWPATRAGEPTAHWSFLYTLYLAGIYSLFGVQPLVARLLQAVLVGILHSWFVYRIGKAVFGKLTGLIAAGLSAIYIYFFYYAGALMTEPFYFVGILWTFDVALRLARMNEKGDDSSEFQPTTWRIWVELGLAIGVTMLLRQLFMLFIPFLYLWLLWVLTYTKGSKQQSFRTVLRGLVLSTVVIMLLILPWTYRNYRVFGTFVPLNTNAGYVIFWGNHPIYGTEFVGILPEGGPSYPDLIPPEYLEQNEAELDHTLLKEGLGFITSDPQRYIWLSLSRIKVYFKFWPSSESGTISNIARVSSFGIMLPLMLYGLWQSLGTAWKSTNPERSSAILLIVLFMIIYTSIHLLSWALVRYRLPVDLFLLIFAAYGISYWWQSRS